MAGGYSYALGFMAGTAVLLSLGWLFLCLTTPDKKNRRFFAVRKIAVILASILCIHFLGDRTFTAKHNVLAMDMWNTEGDYKTKGYLLNLMARVQYLKAEPPQNYSEELVRETAEKYSLQYDAKELEKPEIQPENIIVIMNESWADFRLLPGFQSKKPVMPFIDGLQENVTRGWLFVPTFGGGTAHSEYEVLTGNSNYLLEENPPLAYEKDYPQAEQYLTLIRQSDAAFESLIASFEQAGAKLTDYNKFLLKMKEQMPIVGGRGGDGGGDCIEAVWGIGFCLRA